MHAEAGAGVATVDAIIAPPRAAHASRRADAVTGALIVAVVLVAYANAIPAAWQFDDFATILAHPATQGLAGWWQALPGIRPLLKLSHALVAEAGGGAVAAHATNVAIHALDACLLWRLWRRWLPLLAPTLARADFAAAVAALLFALHPATTEAVTYASGRSISLAATFMLAALLADERSRTHASRAPRWAGPLLFALALAVRETAIVMPAIPLLRAWASGRPLRAELRRLAPYALVLAFAAAVALATPGYHVFFGVSVATRDAAAQALGQLLAHGYLASRPLLGVLNIDPDLRVPDTWSAMLAASAAGLAAAFLAMVHARRRRAWLAFAIGWYFLQLAPANSLLPRLDLANDRHLYLALAGPMLALACLLAPLVERARTRRLAGVIALGACVACAAATVRRNQDYRSEVALWQATVRDSPRKARAWLNLGYAYRLDGEPGRAAAAYRCALRLDPGNAQAAIGLDLVAPGDLSPARCPAGD